MTIKTLTAGVLAVTLSFTSITPTTATADVSRNEALVGITALLLLGAAINNRNDNDDRPSRPSAHTPPRNNAWLVLPANCLRTASRRNGDQINFFGQRCLNRDYRAVNRLPQACHIAFRDREGNRRGGYAPQCLRDHGFRSNRH